MSFAVDHSVVKYLSHRIHKLINVLYEKGWLISIHPVMEGIGWSDGFDIAMILILVGVF